MLKSAVIGPRLQSPIILLRSCKMGSRWIRPEVYPLFAAMVFAVGICGMQLIRNICYNPEVRVKKNRLAGVVENEAEGKKCAEHALRKFVRNRAPEIMPSVNFFFADPTRN